MQLPTRRSDKNKLPDDNDDFLTPETFERLKKQLHTLEKIEHPKAAEDLAHAIQLGDLSENAEYQDAKARIRRINSSILSISERLGHAVIITAATDGVAQIGSTVTLEMNGQNKIYKIVGSFEASPEHGLISHASPLGAALIGYRAGDNTTITTDRGEKTYKIIKVE